MVGAMGAAGEAATFERRQMWTVVAAVVSVACSVAHSATAAMWLSLQAVVEAAMAPLVQVGSLHAGGQVQQCTDCSGAVLLA